MTTVRPIRGTIPLDEARALLFDAVVPIERTERISIREAHGRVIAQAVVSTVDVPPFDRAAMDGYAVIAEDTFGAGNYEPATLRCIETVFTGQVARERVSRGTCIEIATGAPLPARRGRGRDGRGNREGRRATMFACSRRSTRSSTSGGAVPTSPPASPSSRRATCSIRAGSARSRPWASSTSKSSPGRASRSSRPATRSSSPASRSGRDRSTTSTSFTLASIIGAHGGTAVPYPTVADTLSSAHRSSVGHRRRRRAGLLGRELGRRARSHHRRDRPDG